MTKKTKKSKINKKPVLKNKSGSSSKVLGLTQKTLKIAKKISTVEKKTSAKISSAAKLRVSNLKNKSAKTVAKSNQALISDEINNFQTVVLSDKELIKDRQSISPKVDNFDYPVFKKNLTDKVVNFSIGNYRKIGVNFVEKKSLLNQIANYFVDFFTPKALAEPVEEIEDIFAPPPRVKLYNLNLPRHWKKQLAVFSITAFILISPLQAYTYYRDLTNSKDRVLFMTNEAIENLKQGQSSIKDLNLSDAAGKFGEAKENFSSARNEIANLNNLTADLLKILPNQSKTLKSGMALLEAGALASEAGEILTKSVNHIISDGSYQNYYDLLNSFRNDVAISIQKFGLAKDKINEVKPNSLQADQRERLTTVVNYLPAIESGLNQLYQINNSVLSALGENQAKRYLLVFVNSNELRATGGFMGSFATVTINHGRLEQVDIPGGGTYDIQGQLVPKVISPEPLHLINPRWEFQDANWWPDYPSSAKKIQWFYEGANNAKVDGVITITSSVMESLLEIFGPINMPEYERVITKDNFVAETQKIVELEYDKKENRPKKFLADLAPKLLEKVFQAKKTELLKAAELAKNSLNNRQLMIYFNDQSLEKLLTDFGWDGQMRQTDGDYLAVIKSNIAGGKTDGVIKDTIKHQAEIAPDGSIIDTVTLIRRHNGVPGKDIFTGVQNNTYLRFYVPLGSSLIEAKGFKAPAKKLFQEPDDNFLADEDLKNIEGEHQTDSNSGTEIYTENGKTVFGNWLMLKAGSVAEVTIKYRLPFAINSSGQNTFYYSLLTQKQAGTQTDEIYSNLKLNDKLKILAKFPVDLTSNENETSFHAALDTDQFYGVALIGN